MKLKRTRLDLFPRSMVSAFGLEYGLASTPGGHRLAVLGELGNPSLGAFDGEHSEFERRTLILCPLTSHNATTLRKQLSWLQPKPLGLYTSAGMGDRIGIATPGHVRAAREVEGKVAPIFTQQSIREMQRIDRSPQQVMDNATWGIFEEGWQGDMGADADHLKTEADIDACLAVGFTFFTIDPGAYVTEADNAGSLNELRQQAERLPPTVQIGENGLLGNAYDIEGHQIVFDEATLLKAMVKYGRAVAHVARIYHHLEKAAGMRPFEAEVSMDETESPTSPAEHVYIACELIRLGVKWISFAPRFVGSFEKGVDYIGDLKEFEAALAIHAAIARQFGPYKLSLHSGSDKYSIYPMVAVHTRGLNHLKTAGTSYLEGLRTVALADKELFSEIYRFALGRFEVDKISFHVSAQVDRAPKPDDVKDWPAVVDQFDAREILHVTFGSVLGEKTAEGRRRFFDRLVEVLQANREGYFDQLVAHFRRHLQPFAMWREA